MKCHLNEVIFFPKDLTKMIEHLKENINELSEYNEKLRISKESMNEKIEGFNEKLTEIETCKFFFNCRIHLN